MIATGWSLHLPGVHLGAVLPMRTGDWADEDAVAPEQASVLLGRKGMLYKEPATRLALCAVHRALRLPVGHRPKGEVCPNTAVIACGNLGNVDTVTEITRIVAEEGGKAVSVLAAPNASSNVIASTVGRWFRFGGPNLMICSGSRAGMDGLWLADLLLRARRAQRVVLVGVEPADHIASTLYAASNPTRFLRAGAACVVLHASQPGIPVNLSPGNGEWPSRPHVSIGEDNIDPAALWGDCYGGQGVVALALAAHLAADSDEHAVVGIGDSRGVLVGRPA